MPSNELRYERFAPRPALQQIVEHFWLVTAPPILGVRSEILIPNGRPMVLVCLGDPGLRLAADGTRAENQGGLIGILTMPVVLQQSGQATYVGAQLQPWGMAALSPRQRFIDGVQPFAEGASWRGRIAAAPLGSASIKVFEHLLEACVQPLPEGAVSRLADAIRIIDADPNQGVAAAASRLGISYSSLYRLFSNFLGLSPKRYASIMRYYQHLGALLAEAPTGGLAQLAAMRGYFDQAHASRDFRRYTGMSQVEFRRNLNGIAKLMHAPATDWGPASK